MAGVRALHEQSRTAIGPVRGRCSFRIGDIARLDHEAFELTVGDFVDLDAEASEVNFPGGPFLRIDAVCAHLEIAIRHADELTDLLGVKTALGRFRNWRDRRHLRRGSCLA